MSSLKGLSNITKGLTAEPKQGDLGEVVKAIPPRPVAPAAKPPRTKAPVPAAAPTGPKYNNPDFMQLKVYVKRKTKIAAARKWEDAGGRDLSDLIETLLIKYLGS